MFQSILYIAIYVSLVIFTISFIMKGFNALTNIMLKAVGAGEYDNDVSSVSETLKGAIAVWGAETATNSIQNLSSQPAKTGFDKFSRLGQTLEGLKKKKQEENKSEEKKGIK
jgi:hypothetical protein